MPGAVRSRRAFDALSRSRARARSGPIRIVRAEPADATTPVEPAVAYAIGRSVGTAVVRNRLRRRLRALMAELDAAADLRPGTYLVGAGPEAAALDFDELRQHLVTALHRLP